MKPRGQVISLVLVLALVFGAGVFVGRQPGIQTADAQQNDELEATFTPFWEAWELLNQRYVDPLDQETLMLGALEGMLEAVGDPNTSYLSPEELRLWEDDLNNQFEGIGATVRKDEATGGLEIVSPLENSPAQAAGLVAGDIIIEVNGENVTEEDQMEIILRVRGPAGTPVTLGLQREGEEALVEVTVIRDVIIMPGLEYEILDNNVGYIRLYGFPFETVEELRDALIEMDANNLNGLVLDLRGNGGGYLDVSLEVLSQFIEEGPILVQQFAGGEENVHTARGGALAPDVPLAVLVDEGSASASELVAGSLHDRERAVIVGVTTFGKSTVQTVTPISNGGALRISIARWLTPDGLSVDAVGLTPDVVVEYDPTSDPNMDNQLAAAIRALKGLQRNQASVPALGHF